MHVHAFIRAQSVAMTFTCSTLSGFHACRHLRSVQTDDAQQFCEKEGLSFIETSALESTNVELAFQRILTEIYHIVSKKSLASDDNPNKPGEGVKIVVSPENNDTSEKKKPACCGG